MIQDFSPGIRQVKSLNHPLGTADDTTGDRGYATLGCWAGPDGVLKALPSRTDTHERSAAMVFANLTSEQYRICGIFANDPVFSATTSPGANQNNTEIFVGIEYYDSTPNRVRKIVRFSRHESTPKWEIIGTNAVAGAFSATSRPGRCYFATSRSNSAAPGFPGVPVIGWAFGGYARAFPNDTAPTASGTIALPQGAFLPPDLIVGHQGRFVIFPLFQWGDGNMGGADAIVHPDNELIYWTTFNNYLTLDAAFDGVYGQVIAYAERDTGYEFAHSISNDQLLAVKRAGGGLLIQGQLNTSTTIPQPSIRSPGFSLNTGCMTHLGVVYPINSSGVWVIEGGRQSRNLSPYMEPDFWRPRAYGPANPTSLHYSEATGPSYLQTANGWGVDYTSCASWGEWVLMPNNWLLDTTTESWWRLDNSPMTDSGNTDTLGYLESHWWTTDWTGRWAWSAPSGYSNVTWDGSTPTVVLNEYDRLSHRSSFQWLSHPLPLPGSRIVIEDIELTCESFDPSGVDTPSTVSIYVLTDDPTTTTSKAFTPSVRSTNGAMQTLRASGQFAVRGTNVRIYLTSQAGIEAAAYVTEPPRIHRIKITYHEDTGPVRYVP